MTSQSQHRNLQRGEPLWNMTYDPTAARELHLVAVHAHQAPGRTRVAVLPGSEGNLAAGSLLARENRMMRLDAQVTQAVFEPLLLDLQTRHLYRKLSGIRVPARRVLQCPRQLPHGRGGFFQGHTGLSELMEQPPHRFRRDLIQGYGFITLEADQGADQGARDNHHQYPRHPREYASEQDQRRQGTDPEEHGRPMGVSQLCEDTQKVGEKRASVGLRHVEEGVQQGQTDDQRRRVGEAHHHRMRNEIHDDPEPEEAQEKAHQPHHQGQHDRQLDEIVRARDRKRRQGGRGQQREHRHRTRMQEPGGAPKGTDHHGQRRRIQPVHHGQPRQGGVGHALWHQDHRDTQASDHVRTQSRPPTSGTRPEMGKRASVCPSSMTVPFSLDPGPYQFAMYPVDAVGQPCIHSRVQRAWLTASAFAGARHRPESRRVAARASALAA
jgi:hypothetical protein